jgi:hypothetical protein
MTQLENQNKEKMALKRKNIEIMLKREKSARANIERYQEKLEDDRKRFQSMNKEKCNLLFF